MAACNDVFGLRAGTVAPPIDAQYFDAPIDAPFACPAPGSVPMFSTVLHQALVQNCSSMTFSVDAHRAIAICGMPSQIYQGVLDSDLTLEPMTPAAFTTMYTSPQYMISYPALAPEGDVMYALVFGPQSSPSTHIVTFLYGADGTWHDGVIQQVPFTPNLNTPFGTPSRAPNRHAWVSDSGAPNNLRELQEGPTNTWTDASALLPAANGFQNETTPQLSPDGKRGIATAFTASFVQTVVYASRPNITSPFEPFAALSTLPQQINSPFLTEHCERVYFYAVAQILYVQQR